MLNQIIAVSGRMELECATAAEVAQKLLEERVPTSTVERLLGEFAQTAHAGDR